MNEARAQSETLWRLIFGLAAAYNFAFGVWAVVWPFGFFDTFELTRPIYPGIWACLGMVIGVYGLGYACIAWKPAHGDVLALLGLIGKVLGPLGWLVAVRQGELPARTFPLIVFNDLVWWYPFLAYLLRRSPKRRVRIVWLAVAFHIAASVMLLVVRDGTDAQPDFAIRLQFINSHMSAWVMCWFLWVAASLGLMTFFILWATCLAESGAGRLLLVISCTIAIVGLGFDLMNEIILVAKVTTPGMPIDEFGHWARRASLLGAGIGNGCYSIAGVLMSAIAWRVGFLRGALHVLGLAVWVCGFALSAAAFSEHHAAMTWAGATLMTLFISWATLIGLRFARTAGRS